MGDVQTKEVERQLGRGASLREEGDVLILKITWRRNQIWLWQSGGCIAQMHRTVHAWTSDRGQRERQDDSVNTLLQCVGYDVVVSGDKFCLSCWSIYAYTLLGWRKQNDSSPKDKQGFSLLCPEEGSMVEILWRLTDRELKVIVRMSHPTLRG